MVQHRHCFSTWVLYLQLSSTAVPVSHTPLLCAELTAHTLRKQARARRIAWCMTAWVGRLAPHLVHHGREDDDGEGRGVLDRVEDLCAHDSTAQGMPRTAAGPCTRERNARVLERMRHGQSCNGCWHTGTPGEQEAASHRTRFTQQQEACEWSFCVCPAQGGHAWSTQKLLGEPKEASGTCGRAPVSR